MVRVGVLALVKISDIIFNFLVDYIFSKLYLPKDRMLSGTEAYNTVGDSRQQIEDGKDDVRNNFYQREDFKMNQLNRTILAQAALHAPHEVALQCVADHCYYQLSVFFLMAQAACVRHACLRAPCVAWPLYYHRSLFSLFSPSFAF